MLDPRAIFDQADTYLLASNVLEQQASHAKPQLAMPFAVYGAFALELYFKCLLAMERKTIRREHDHVQLLGALAPATQSKIRAAFDNLPGAKLREALAKKMGTKIDYDTSVAVGKDIFKNWRYAYEGPSDHSSGWIPDVVLATRNAILDMQPAWPRELTR